jgi:hypothetical protein
MSLTSSPIINIPVTDDLGVIWTHLGKRIDEFRASSREKMGKVVRGEIGLKLWSPRGDGEYSDFLRNLKIPIDPSKKPDMLLFDLGRLEKDPRLRGRLQKLFGSDLSHK